MIAPAFECLSRADRRDEGGHDHRPDAGGSSTSASSFSRMKPANSTSKARMLRSNSIDRGRRRSATSVRILSLSGAGNSLTGAALRSATARGDAKSAGRKVPEVSESRLAFPTPTMRKMRRPKAGRGNEAHMMTRIVEHRSALPFGPVVEVHVRHDAERDSPVYATVLVQTFGQNPDPEAFPPRLPVDDAFVQALGYAEQAGIACVWINDPRGYSPPKSGQTARKAAEPRVIHESYGGGVTFLEVRRRPCHTAKSHSRHL